MENRIDTTSQIGALELSDHLESHSDGVLEATMGPHSGRTMVPCTITQCIGDGTLESAGAESALMPTYSCNGPTFVCH
jgi:hypothetical protein